MNTAKKYRKNVTLSCAIVLCCCAGTTLSNPMLQGPVYSDMPAASAQDHSLRSEQSADQVTLRELLEFAVVLVDASMAVNVSEHGRFGQVQSGASDERVFGVDDLPEDTVAYLGTNLDKITAWLRPVMKVIEPQQEMEHELSGIRGEVMVHVQSVLATLAQEQPEDALAIALQSTEDPERESLVLSVLLSWSDDAPQAALQWLERRDTTENHLPLSEFRSGILYSWMDREPDVAVQALEGMPEFEGKAYIYAQYAAQMGQEDPAAAFYWSQSQPVAAVRELATENVMINWAHQDPDTYLAFIATLNSKTQNDLLQKTVGAVAYTMAYESPHKVLSWAESLSGQSRQVARLAAFEVWYASAPNEALANRLVLLDPDEQEKFLSSVAHGLPQHDMLLAQSLFERGDEDTRYDLSVGIVAEKFKQDPLEARLWVDQLAQDSAQSTAYLALVDAMSELQPEDALEYLSDYTNEDQASVFEQGLWVIASRSPTEFRLLLDRTNLLDKNQREAVKIFIKEMDNADYAHGC